MLSSFFAFLNEMAGETQIGLLLFLVYRLNLSKTIGFISKGEQILHS